MAPRKEVASAAGTAALVYLVLSVRLSSAGAGDGAEAALRREEEEEENGKTKKGERRWPERAPASWREAAEVATRTVGFAYGATLGRWPLGDIAFGINHYMRVQVR